VSQNRVRVTHVLAHATDRANQKVGGFGVALRVIANQVQIDVQPRQDVGFGLRAHTFILSHKTHNRPEVKRKRPEISGLFLLVREVVL